MRHLVSLLALLALLVMAGCGTINPFPKHVYSTPPSAKGRAVPSGYDPKTNPYTVMGRTYYPLKTAHGYDEVGMASWYGKDFHGKKTANGYIYNMYGVTAAHKLLPLGTEVQVTNLENNRSIVLVINDRGPFVHGRILDLSYGAAKKLGTVERGVAKVRITAVGTVPGAKTQVAVSSAKQYHVRVGAFADKSNAERVHRRLVDNGYGNANIKMVFRNGQVLHVVQAGSFSSRDRAEQVLERLKDDFPTSYIIS
ncbi:septal ring lytic transglycosylase RlpA family protein [uncultured Pseudodesulfovibrio sp.]|uniref:septal ring lytic transglycosylase RlpA family protein n=1 Tax=uncultured Pseudodesulfovibrio sp. TaxID=2035858 RepID=UPI0029C714BB|nr:septal ring lytic transglycosylase RlpA family protein [uncultured Pseudodesulfovibrio sp.]